MSDRSAPAAVGSQPQLGDTPAVSAPTSPAAPPCAAPPVAPAPSAPAPPSPPLRSSVSATKRRAVPGLALDLIEQVTSETRDNKAVWRAVVRMPRAATLLAPDAVASKTFPFSALNSETLRAIAEDVGSYVPPAKQAKAVAFVQEVITQREAEENKELEDLDRKNAELLKRRAELVAQIAKRRKT